MQNTTPIADKMIGRQIAIILLASALGISAHAQQAQSTQNDQTAPVATSERPSTPSSNPAVQPGKEGFWGHMNPFARKKWVKKQIDPLNDRLGELDEVNSKNARDIRDVDSRAQAGIRRAQGTADAANQTATIAGTKAQQANSTATNANNHVDSLNSTVNSLDVYDQKAEVVLDFRGGQPILSKDARSQLDDLATKLNGQPGYIIELEAHAPGAGSVGIQNSKKLADAVERYLVVQHEIPVYRLHMVALGNAPSPTVASENPIQDKPAHPKPVRTSSVHIRLMENSLAAQGSAAPLAGAASSTGTERP